MNQYDVVSTISRSVLAIVEAPTPEAALKRYLNVRAADLMRHYPKMVDVGRGLRFAKDSTFVRETVQVPGTLW